MESRIVLALLLTLTPIGLIAQQPQTAPPPENQPVDDVPLTLPVTLDGQSGSLAFQSETPSESYLKGGVGLTGSYTDNALLTTANKLDNFSYQVQPHIAWSEITSKFTLNLGLTAGVIFNNNLSTQNQGAESVNLGAAWRLTEHLSFRLVDTFTNTTGMFSSIGSQPQGTGVGVVQQSNNSLLVPPAQRTLSNQSLAELTDQVGPHTVAGIRGTYWLLDYPQSSQSAQFGTLYDTRAYSAEAFYDWRFAAKQWLGVTVRGQRFQTLPAIATTDVGGLLLSYSVTPSPTVTFTFFGGPEYSNTPLTTALAALGVSGQGRFWTSSEGATLNWEASRTSANVSFVRQLNDGGGLASAVILQGISAKLRQKLSNHQNEVEFGVADSKSEPVLSGASIEGVSAFALFEQRFARGFVIQVGYSWLRQDLLLGTVTPADANRAWFSVSYDFLRPLGK
jgi:hypothetical protein